MANNDGSFQFADGNSTASKYAINVDNTNESPQSHVVIDCPHDLSMETNSDAHTETDEYHVSTLCSDDADDNIQTPAHATSNDAEHMIKHTSKHNIRNNLVCTICNRQYKHRQSLHRHITRDHPETQPSGQIKCQEESCSFMCRYLHQLREHLTTIHNIQFEKETKVFNSYSG